MKTTAHWIQSFFCLPFESFDHRLVGEDCRGGVEASEGSLNRLREYNYVDRDCIQRTSADERLRGHQSFSLISPFGQMLQPRSRGGACVSAVCPYRLSVYMNERLHLCTCGVRRFIFSP